jgi:hypothetical protein
MMRRSRPTGSGGGVIVAAAAAVTVALLLTAHSCSGGAGGLRHSRARCQDPLLAAVVGVDWTRLDEIVLTRSGLTWCL